MKGGSIVREARRRAGISQEQLAARLSTTQSAVARMERGRTEPSFARVVEAVRVCGLDLLPRLLEVDDADWSVASANLALTIDQRVEQHQAALAFALAAREARRGG
jgi:ribosome-binding protein aMBF1 (putative translation factor)